MKPALRVSGFLALFANILHIYLGFTQFDFLPVWAQGYQAPVYLFHFAGNILGVFLCPLLLPLPDGAPGKKKTLPALSCVFIAVVFLSQIVMRFAGTGLWLGSLPLRIAIAVNAGLINTLVYGLFFLSQMHGGHESSRTSRFCPPALAMILLGAMFARYFSLPLLRASGLAGNTDRAFAFMSALDGWLILAAGICAAVCTVLLARLRAAVKESPAVPAQSDTGFIVRLFAMSALFFLLNSLMEMRLLAMVSGLKAVYGFNVFLVSAAVLPLCIWAGKAERNFYNRFLPGAIAVFIILPCLPLFQERPLFILIMSTLAAIVHYTIWIVFSVSLVEHYRGHFWFYFIAVAIHFSHGLSLTGSLLHPIMPETTEFAILLMTISAAAFALLSFRLLSPKTQVPAAEPGPAPLLPSFSIDEILREHKLTIHEAAVARLMIKEGLRNEKIAQRIFRSTATVELYATRIYRKFSVQSRAEFISLFVRK